MRKLVRDYENRKRDRERWRERKTASKYRNIKNTWNT